MVPPIEIMLPGLDPVFFPLYINDLFLYRMHWRSDLLVETDWKGAFASGYKAAFTRQGKAIL